MRPIYVFACLFFVLLHAGFAHGQWCQRISADYLAPGVNEGITQNDGSHWVAGLYRGFLEIPGPAGPVQFTSPTSGDPSEYRYTGYIARYLPDASLAWAKEIRSNFNRLLIQHITPVPDGSVIVVGNYTGPIVFNQGESDQFILPGTNESIFIARYQPSGALMWAKSLPGNGLFFAPIAFSHWHNNELFLSIVLNNGDLDLDPGSGTTRLFAPFLLPNQQNYCFGRYTANGDFIQGGNLARGAALTIGEAVTIGQKIALPVTFSDSAQLFMGQTTAQQSLRAPGVHAATLITSNLTSINATYQTSPAQIGDSTTGFLVDLAVIDNKIHQIVGVGLGKLRINPNNPNDTLIALSNSSYTQFEVVIDSSANYLSHRLVGAFTGPTASTRYARGEADSLLSIFAAPGFIFEGTTYSAARSIDQMAGLLKRNGTGYSLTKTARANMFSIPLVASGGGQQYFQIRWQDSIHFNNSLYHTAPLSRHFIEVCKLNDNGLSLGVADQSAAAVSLQLYPNPASHQLKFKPQSSGHIDIQLFDLQGRRLYETQISGDHEHQIDITHLPAGMYFCRWESGGQTGQIKWLKE